MCVCIYVCACVCVCVYERMCVFVCVSVRVQMCVCAREREREREKESERVWDALGLIYYPQMDQSDLTTFVAVNQSVQTSPFYSQSDKIIRSKMLYSRYLYNYVCSLMCKSYQFRFV